MKTILIIFLTAACCAGCCPAGKSRDVLVKIEGYSMSSRDFVNEVTAMPYLDRAGKTKEELLDDIIQKKILLLEAQRQGMDRQPSFMSAIQRFWEQTLLRTIIEKKMNEFTAAVTARGDEGRAQKITARFEEWLKDVRANTKVSVNKKALEHIKLPLEE